MLTNTKRLIQRYATEILAGTTVSLALVPEAIAFALIAGFSPSVGIFTSFFICLITSVLGGKPAMISGASGAIAVVITIVAKTYDLDYVFAVVILAGVFQIAIGLLRLAKFVVLVSRNVMLGFVNGLAIIIFVSQLTHFQNTAQVHEQLWLAGPEFSTMLAIVGGTVAIVLLIPKIWKPAPAAFVALVLVSSVVLCFDIQTPSVGDLATLDGDFPVLHIPAVPVTLSSVMTITLYAIFVAWVGTIESLLTLDLMNQITGPTGNGNREMVAQGLGNAVAGLFSGMGGCVMVGQSLINVSSGGRWRLSGIVASFMLLFFATSGGTVLAKMPTGVLVGIMITVAFQTFNWESLRTIYKKPLPEQFVLVLVMTITVLTHNIAIAVMLGIIASCIVFAWQSAQRLEIVRSIEDNNKVTYQIIGPLFFGSAPALQDHFDSDDDHNHILFDFSKSWISDASAAQTLVIIMRSYKDAGKEISITNLDRASTTLLDRSLASLI